MAVTTLYHGAHTRFAPHEGQCFTRDRDVARRYGRTGYVATVELDLDALVVERCPGYDHDQNYAPADDPAYRRAAAERGVDVLVYEDEDETGWPTDCYRLVSERALAAVRVVAVVPAAELDW